MAVDQQASGLHQKAAACSEEVGNLDLLSKSRILVRGIPFSTRLESVLFAASR